MDDCDWYDFKRMLKSQLAGFLEVKLETRPSNKGPHLDDNKPDRVLVVYFDNELISETRIDEWPGQ